MKTSVQKIAIALFSLLVILHPINGRYLPTRSQGNDLDKLRELMIDILDSSNEVQEGAANNHHNNINELDSTSSKLTNSQRLSLARNIFGSNGGNAMASSKDDNEFLAAYLNRYGSGGSSHRNGNSLNNKLYGRVQY